LKYYRSSDKHIKQLGSAVVAAGRDIEAILPSLRGRPAMHRSLKLIGREVVQVSANRNSARTYVAVRASAYEMEIDAPAGSQYQTANGARHVKETLMMPSNSGNKRCRYWLRADELKGRGSSGSGLLLEGLEQRPSARRWPSSTSRLDNQASRY